jgi:hypothetical protein
MSISSMGRSSHQLHGTKPITVTVADAKKLSGLGNTTIWALIKAKRLQTVSVGRRRLIIFSSLEAVLAPEEND